MWPFKSLILSRVVQLLFVEDMLLKESTTVKFNSKWMKILQASVAFKNTFVFVRIDAPCAEQTIVHTDHTGKILFEKKYNDVIDFFGMLNDKEVIVCNVPESKIDIINLETHKIMQVNNQYAFDDTCSMEMFTFPETKYFCIVERGDPNDARLIITYFDYNGINEDSQPLCRWEGKNGEWTYEHEYAKGNNHSKVLIWKYQHDQEFVFTYFDLKEDPKGKFSEVKARIQIGAQYGVGDIQLKVFFLWESRPNNYTLVAISNKSEHKEKTKDKNGIHNNNYIIDTSLGNDQATIRETKYVFDIEKDGFCYNDQLTSCFGMGNVSVFHSFRHIEGKVQNTPVYYVNNETEEIIERESWECIVYHDNYFLPGWDATTLVQSTFDMGDVEEATINVKKVVEPKEISMHFLLHMNQDFDDDLLQDAVELLH